ncbi:MAG: pyridoxamine kinase [Deltaproteobacteria bacterium]|nr:pyridoxamine kinase [Deltaproteobacteria bacterium]
MPRPVTRVAAIHDLSGFGGGSLAAVIPILSAMRIQVCSLPTAVLSTHTGGFEGYRFVDLTEHMPGFIAHWKSLGLAFDCIYSGFLGSVRQICMVENFIDDFRRDDQIVVVDPVLGDDGRLYATMPAEMVVEMRRLVAKADLITPNVTEAALLLGHNPAVPPRPDRVRGWLEDLSALGPRRVVVTSVPVQGLSEGSAVLAYDRATGRMWRVSCTYVPTSYPGTGDIFASVLTGAILQGDSLPIALDRAVQFVALAIRTTFGHGTPAREGVFLERVLDSLNAPVTMSSYEIVS